MKMSIGADPEFLVAREGIPINAHGLIPGTKLNPYKVDKGAVQVDGMALEYNIDPCSSKDQFIDHIISVRDTMLNMAGVEAYLKPVAFFSDEVMKEADPESLILGCEPDYNAYLQDQNNPPDTSQFPNMRSAGGHIHIGYKTTGDITEDFYNAARMARLMDEHVGVPSMGWDNDHLRRQLYGKAGAFRVKPYGMEYRTLSNVWAYNENSIGHVYDLTQHAFNMFQEGEDATYDVREVIDHGPE